MNSPQIDPQAYPQADATPVLSIRDVTRTYDTAAGGLTVLKGVNLDVMPGEIVGLIGLVVRLHIFPCPVFHFNLALHQSHLRPPSIAGSSP